MLYNFIGHSQVLELAQGFKLVSPNSFLCGLGLGAGLAFVSFPSFSNMFKVLIICPLPTVTSKQFAKKGRVYFQELMFCAHLQKWCVSIRNYFSWCTTNIATDEAPRIFLYILRKIPVRLSMFSEETLSFHKSHLHASQNSPILWRSASIGKVLARNLLLHSTIVGMKHPFFTRQLKY